MLVAKHRIGRASLPSTLISALRRSSSSRFSWKTRSRSLGSRLTRSILLTSTQTLASSLFSRSEVRHSSKYRMSFSHSEGAVLEVEAPDAVVPSKT